MLSIRHFATATSLLWALGITGISPAGAQKFSLESLNTKNAADQTTKSQFAPTKLRLSDSPTRDFDAVDHADPEGDQVKQGLTQLQQGHFQEAVNIFNTVLKDKPHDATALAARAFARYQLDDVNYALADAAESVRYDPKCQMAYKVRAVILSDQGDYDGSLDACKSGLQLGEDSELLAVAAKNLYCEKDFVHAVYAADNALQLNKADTLAMNVRGLSDMNLYDNLAAINDFTQILQNNPNSYISYLNRARSYLQLDRFSLALADLNKSIAINADEPDAYCMRALAFSALKDKTNAMKDADKLVDMAKTSAISHRVRGYVLEDSGDMPGATKEYKLAAFLYRKAQNSMGADEMMSNVARLQNTFGTAQQAPADHLPD